MFVCLFVVVGVGVVVVVDGVGVVVEDVVDDVVVIRSPGCDTQSSPRPTC